MTQQDPTHRSRAPRIAAIAASAGAAVAVGTIAGIGAALCSIVFDTEYPNSTFAHKRNDRLHHAPWRNTTTRRRARGSGNQASPYRCAPMTD